MKKFTFALLSFVYSMYLTIGANLIFFYFVLFAIALSRRRVELDMAPPIPPYPYFTVIRFWVCAVIFIAVAILLTYYLLEKFKTVLVKWPLKSVLLIIPVICGYLLTTSVVNYWRESPPMSKERAIEIATEYYGNSTLYDLKSITWNKKGGYWFVILSSLKGNSCDYFRISRLGTNISGGECKDIYE